MTENAKPKRKTKASYLDTWEPCALPDRPQSNMPERKLLTTIIQANVQAAMRGDTRSLHWINCLDGAFVEICHLLEFQPSMATRIREAVNTRQIAMQSRFKGNQYRPAPKASAAPIISPDPAPQTGLPAIQGAGMDPWVPEIVLEPVTAIPCDAAPVVVDGWVGQLDWVPLPKRTRKRRN